MNQIEYNRASDMHGELSEALQKEVIKLKEHEGSLELLEPALGHWAHGLVLIAHATETSPIRLLTDLITDYWGELGDEAIISALRGSFGNANPEIKSLYEKYDELSLNDPPHSEIYDA